MPPAKRKINTQLIHKNQCYSMDDIIELYGVHKSTVRNWLSQGLKRIDDHRPYLIHGSDLKEYLNKIQKRRKRPCKIDEIYCLKCRKPQKVWGNLVDIKIQAPSRFQIMGICVECEKSTFKAISTKNIPELANIFNIQKTVDRNLMQCDDPFLNSLLSKEDEK